MRKIIFGLIILCLVGLMAGQCQAADSWRALTYGEKPAEEVKNYYLVELETPDGKIIEITPKGAEKIIYLNETELSGVMVRFTPLEKVKWFEIKFGRKHDEGRATKDDITGWMGKMPLELLSSGDNYIELSDDDDADVINLMVVPAEFINDPATESARQLALSDGDNYFYQQQLIPGKIIVMTENTEIVDLIVPNMPEETVDEPEIVDLIVPNIPEEPNYQVIYDVPDPALTTPVEAEEAITTHSFYDYLDKSITIDEETLKLREYPHIIVWSDKSGSFIWSFDNIKKEEFTLDEFYQYFIALMKVNMNDCTDSEIPIFINGEEYRYCPGTNLIVELK